LGLIEVVVRSCRFYLEVHRSCCSGTSYDFKFSVAYPNGVPHQKGSKSQPLGLQWNMNYNNCTFVVTVTESTNSYSKKIIVHS
jgi:hypothetical protein